MTTANIANINTKIGTFTISDNGNNGTILLQNGEKIWEFPKTAWWNIDELTQKISEYKEAIVSKIQKIKKKETISNDPVQLLNKAKEALQGKEKGFYDCRIKQCLNRLNKPEN